MDAANQTPHTHHSSLLQDIPPWALPAIGFMFWLYLHPYSAIPSAIVGYVAWSISEKKREAREAAARVASWANICGAQVVQSYDPNEGPDVVSERAKQWRENLRMSGNIYWQEIPIIEYPFQPMIFGLGELTYAWDIYQRMVGEKRHIENLKWVDGKCPKELRGAVLSQILPAPKQEEN